MRTRIVILLAVLALLLVGSVVQAQPRSQVSTPAYVVAQGQVTGGAYRLAGGSWQISGTASGPGYRLEGSGINQGAGCCCTYLPCLLRAVTP